MSIHSAEYLETLAKARALANQGWKTEGKEEAIALANEALALCSDCAEAYLLLGSRQAQTFEKSVGFAHTAKEAAIRAIGGQEAFDREIGTFWRTAETRSYLRSLEAVANIEWIRNDYVKSNEAYREMLYLSPVDEQGGRIPFTDGLVKLEEFEELERIFLSYNADMSINFFYNRALMLFKRDGGTEEASKAMFTAIDRNQHVPSYLLGRKRFPADPRYFPPSEAYGDDNEALDYAYTNITIWRKSTGATRWLRKHVREYESSWSSL